MTGERTMKSKKEIVSVLCGPFALTPRPFLAPAKNLKMSEAALLKVLRQYKVSGLIRRIGIVLGHRQAGLKCNALVVWKVKSESLEKTGKLFSGFRQVSHCYARRPRRDWPYTLYTMIHERNKKGCLCLIGQMAHQAGVPEHRILFTKKEFKKTKADLKGIFS